MAKNERSKGSGSLFRQTTAHPIPTGWTLFQDKDADFGRRDRWYAVGTSAAHGSKRFPLNKAHDAILVPSGPWIASWYDHSGKRQEHSTRTTDRQAAERILNKFIADAALRRDLVIDPRDDRFALEGRTDLSEHISAYLAHCTRVGLDTEHLASKENHLRRLREVSRISKLHELTADALERYLTEVKAAGRSARSINFARQLAVAFCGWCVKTGRLETNPLRVVPKQDESRDRRRVRRPLTDDETSRLLAVARANGREAWYLAAALAGLRRGDLRSLTWADVNQAEGTITIRAGKAKRVDVIPMHPQLADALRRQLEAFPALPTAKVWSEAVTNVTRQKDFLRAGIARRVPVLDADGKPIMIGEGTKAKPKMRIAFEDEDGRVIDLHSLRTTLGTQLARAGVAPQVAQRIMRHSDYKTTLKHYTVLGLTDTAAAVARLPGITCPESKAMAATGTTDSTPANPPLFSPLLSRGNGQNSAASRGHTPHFDTPPTNEKTRISAGQSEQVRDDAGMERKRLELSTSSLQS